MSNPSQPMDCSPTGSCVHGMSQVRILEWVNISFFRGFSPPRDWTQVSCIAGRFRHLFPRSSLNQPKTCDLQQLQWKRKKQYLRYCVCMCVCGGGGLSSFLNFLNRLPPSPIQWTWIWASTGRQREVLGTAVHVMAKGQTRLSLWTPAKPLPTSLFVKLTNQWIKSQFVP